MSLPLILAVVAALAFGMLSVFQKLMSPYILGLFGALMISISAVILELIILIPQLKSATLFTNPRGIFFAILAGICAMVIDVAALKAYGSGLPVTIGGPIIFGGGIATLTIVGFFLGESMEFAKILGIILIISGSIILGSLSK